MEHQARGAEEEADRLEREERHGGEGGGGWRVVDRHGGEGGGGWRGARNAWA